MSDENVGGLPPLSEEIQGFLNVHPFGYSHALGLLKRYARDAISAHGGLLFTQADMERFAGYVADAREERLKSAHGQPEPRVSQAMLDSQLETARLLDDLEKRSEARREKYGLHGQPVDYSPALHSVLSYIAYGECDEEGLHPGLFATVKEKIDKLRSKPVVDAEMVRLALHYCPTDMPSPEKWRWIANHITAALTGADHDETQKKNDCLVCRSLGYTTTQPCPAPRKHQKENGGWYTY